jgi:hypothetical protein
MQNIKPIWPDAGKEPDQMVSLMALYARDPTAATAMYQRRKTAAAAAPAATKKKNLP